MPIHYKVKEIIEKVIYLLRASSKTMFQQLSLSPGVRRLKWWHSHYYSALWSVYPISDISWIQQSFAHSSQTFNKPPFQKTLTTVAERGGLHVTFHNFPFFIQGYLDITYKYVNMTIPRTVAWRERKLELYEFRISNRTGIWQSFDHPLKSIPIDYNVE